jgi:hypothetical protein
MSDPLAIAAVTHAFSALLSGVTEDANLDPVTVSALAPDRARQGQNSTVRQLNLFLYQVTPNPGWQNEDLPQRNAAGNLVQTPVLALDLHYLLTAYGLNNRELDAHHVLAHAMSVVHDRGIMRRSDVQTALDGAAPPLNEAGLADQVELIKLCPETLTDEELFRMWTVFGTEYRISVGYLASVVLVQRRHTTRSVPPARASELVASPFEPPVIAEVRPRPVTAGQPIVLLGEHLDASAVTVRFGPHDVAPAPGAVEPGRIEVALPAELRAGPNTVQVLHDLDLPQGGTRRFASSNVVAFVLAPRIASALPPDVARGDVLEVELEPEVERRQRVRLLLDDLAIERDVTPADPDVEAEVRFTVPTTLVAGDVLVRVSVDGAETPLTVSAAGVYDGPTVAVT